MAYPQTNAPITEFLINGVWTDITATNSARADPGITITRGKSSEQGAVGPQTSTFTVNNRNGRFSNRNPNSIYYGLLPRNTQVRHRAGDGDNYLWIPFNDQPGFNEVRTADKAVLDIVGDIEVRADIWPHTWRPPIRNPGQGNGTMVIAAKWALTGNQGSWVLYLLSDGSLRFGWTPDGTIASRITAVSTVSVPVTTGRLSVKVTLDVNNGAAGWTANFATASSINGTYTALGAAVTVAGVTSIFSSSAALTIGTCADSAAFFTGGLTYGGRLYEIQVRNSIGGTLVANPIFGSQALGATSFSDGLGTPNTWALSNKARIISDRMRYVGELSKLPQVWDQSARDFTVPVSSGGLLQRLTNTGQTLGSAMTRQFSTLTSSGYWPLEDGSVSQTASSPIAGVPPASLYTVTMGGTSPIPGASSVATFGDPTTGSQIIFTPKNVPTTASMFAMFFISCPTPLPAGAKTIANFFGTGTVRRIDVILSTGGWRFDFIAADGSTLDSTISAFTSVGGSNNPSVNPVGVNILMTESAGTISWFARWLPAGHSVFFGIGPSTFAGTRGIWTQARITAKNAVEFQGMQLSHVFLSSADVGFVSSPVQNAMNAYDGELAANRIDRLGTEQGVATEIIGQWDRTAAMGFQTTDTFVNLVQSCAAADGGILGEGRSMLALTYRCAADLETRRDLTLDESLFHLTEPPLPSEDDQGFTNDVTMTRTGGSTARDVIAANGYHQLSVQAPPLGVGTVTGGGTVTVALDSQLPDIAGWKAHVGSWDEPRFPNIKVSLHRSAIGTNALAEQVRGLDLGDTISLVHLPATVMPPDDVQLLTQGYTETLKKLLWDITFNTSPGGPYRTGRYDQADAAGTPRYTTSGSTVSTAVNTVLTTLVLAYSTAGDNWTTTGASYPFDIMIEGERITLTSAPAGSTSPQTFTGVTRSVNGIVKAHGVGAVVELFDTCYYSL
jgi:hypothetical protein